MNNDNCAINITPEISRADEPVSIKISGLLKNEKVTIRIVSDDYYCINAPIRKVGDNTLWDAYATFIADEYGNVDLGNTTPIDGTYKTCNAMGLFYSMKVKENKRGKLIQKLSDISENRKCTITCTVERDGKVITSKDHTRVFCDETIESVDVVEKKLLARYFTSKNNMKRPAVIVVSGSDGRIEKAQAIAEIFAMKGYSALAVCYFGLEGTSKDLNCVPLEYIENAITWLKKQDTVNKDKIAMYGRSKGGEMVFLAASIFPDITCVIANMPSCYAYEGIKKGGLPARHSSWMYKGEEISCLKFSCSIILQLVIKMLQNREGALSWMYKKLIDEGNTDEATIAVNKINGPILMISSESDSIWPSKMHSEMAMKLLEKSNFKYEYKHITYEKSGHMLTVPFQSIPRLKGSKVDIDSWAKANIDAWNETINFLEKWAKKYC